MNTLEAPCPRCGYPLYLSPNPQGIWAEENGKLTTELAALRAENERFKKSHENMEKEIKVHLAENEKLKQELLVARSGLCARCYNHIEYKEPLK